MDAEQKRLAEELFFSGPKKTSFAKLLYFGFFDDRRVIPYPTPPEAEKEQLPAFLSRLESFISAEVDPDAIDRNATIPDRVICGLGDMGLLGMTIPREYGGLSMSQYAYCRSMELLARSCASSALFVNAHQSIGLKALVLYGTEEQKRKWLPDLATGRKIGAFSLTEPNAGSDVANIQTRAVFDPDRRTYRITGRKQWTTNGSIAHVLTVMAKTEVDTPEGKQQKVTAFIVTPDMPGFRVLAPALEKVGMRGTKTANLGFENLEVPAENVLGPLGGGLRLCLTVLDYGRTTFGATCTGAAKFAVEQAIRHARSREQFKRPIASFGLVKQKIANMAALAYAMDATTYMTAGMIDEDAEDFMLEAAILKVFTSDALWTILYDTMQIYGGRSFFTDQPFERMMRDARLNMIGEGSNEVMRAFIGAVGMRDVGVGVQDAMTALRRPIRNARLLYQFLVANSRRLRRPRIRVRSPLLHAEANELGRRVKNFGMAIPRLLVKYQEDIVEKQLLLDRIATSAIALYTTTAVISRLDSQIAAAADVETVGDDLAAGKLYCRQAFATIDSCLGSLFRNLDGQVEAVADRLTRGVSGEFRGHNT